MFASGALHVAGGYAVNAAPAGIFLAETKHTPESMLSYEASGKFVA